MADFVYDKAKPRLIGGLSDAAIVPNTDTFKFALLKPSHTPGKSTHEFYSDVSADEISGSGYTAGGETLVSTLSRIGATVKFDADDVSYPTLSPEFRYAVVYDNTHASKALVGLLDFLTTQIPNGAPVDIAFNANGIFTFTDG